ncbi:MAG: bifunctional nicotinamidase/pyrazinamidase [Planctomycetota bacterium]|jgi:nicotinamidase/pyrazinamidase
MKRTDALIVVDIQNDFCPMGALPVSHGDTVVPIINRLVRQFPLAVATQDWHPPGHISFASSHPGKNPFDVIDVEGVEQILWPDHCVQGTEGSAFHPDFDARPYHAVVRKGMAPHLDSYSAFRDNAHVASTGLAGYLRERGIDTVWIAGLATDFCVTFTAHDALDHGFQTRILIDACRGIDVPPGSLEAKLTEIQNRGGRIVHGRSLPESGEGTPSP